MTGKFEAFKNRAIKSLAFAKQVAKLDFSDAIDSLLDQQKISRADFADRLGTSRAYVTKVLRGDVNVTIDTMVELVHHAGGKLNISVERAEAATGDAAPKTNIQWEQYSGAVAFPLLVNSVPAPGNSPVYELAA